MPAVAFAAPLGFFLPKRRRLPLLLSLLLIAALTSFTGCGTDHPAGNTPTGNYMVTVITIGGNTTQTATINLTVQTC